MKINYTTHVRMRRDDVRIVVGVEESDAPPVDKRGLTYQPTVVLVTYSRKIQKGTPEADLDLDAHEWSEEHTIQGHRVLKSGALGEQAVRLFYGTHEDSWITNALDLAKWKFYKIIDEWPDPLWPSEESLLIP